MKPPTCPYCKYDLRGLGDDSKQCPECGKRVDVLPVTLRARRLADPSIGRDVAAGILLSLLVLIVVLALFATREALWTLVFVPIPAVVLCVMAGARRRRAVNPIGRPWSLELRTSPKGLFVVEPGVSSQTIEYATNWVDLVFIDLLAFGDDRPIVHIKSGTIAQDGWFELDCSYDDARTTVYNINWLRSACGRARMNPVGPIASDSDSSRTPVDVAANT